MGALLSYSIYSSILLSILYLSYKWVLAGENQLRFNRAVLWSIYVVSLAALPLSGLLESLQHVQSVPLAPIDFENLAVTEVPYTDYVEEEVPRQPLYLTVMLWLYLAGMVAVLCQTLWIAIRLGRIISRGVTVEEGRFRVIVIDDEGIAPFSWCRYVVMSRRDWEENGRMILTHELQHLGLRHWIDLLVAQLVGIFQWYNPAAWLMREELKAVHEYQADRAVLESGVGARDYQMLLIRKAVGAKFPSLANSLNHSKLKKRITMMYAGRTSARRRLRGLLLLPALGVAIALTGFSVVASVISDTASAEFMSDSDLSETLLKEAGPVEPVMDEAVPAEEVSIVSTSATKAAVEERGGGAEVKKDVPPPVLRNEAGEAEEPALLAASEASPKVAAESGAVAEPALEPSVQQLSASTHFEGNFEKVLTVVEKKPMFPGGESELLKYVSRNIRYPLEAQKNNIQGRVVLQFVVKNDGSIGPVRVIRHKDPLLDEEAVRVVKSLPSFIPGELNGEPVSVWYTLPVSFKLKDDVPAEVKKLKEGAKILSYESHSDGTTKKIVLSGKKLLSDSVDIYIDGKPYKGNLDNVSPSQIASIDVWRKPRSVIHIKMKEFSDSSL